MHVKPALYTTAKAILDTFSFSAERPPLPSLMSLSISDSLSRRSPGSLRANIRMTAGVRKAALMAACVA